MVYRILTYKQFIHYLSRVTALCLACGLVGCATGREGRVEVRGSSEPLVPDSRWEVPVDVTFRVPADYLPRRSRLVITPQLMIGDSARADYEPVVLDAVIYAKKRYRSEMLEGYQDPYREEARLWEERGEALEIPYHTTVALPSGTREAELRAVVSTDGCGECSGIDTIPMASIVDPLSRLRPTLRVVEPKFVVREKTRDGAGKAHLQFVINRFDMNPDLGNNRAEMDGMLGALRPVLTDTLATLNSLAITGIASADGPLSLNTPLARNRAEAAKEWLVGRLGIPADVARKIAVDSRPEGWEPVLEAMRAANDPDADAVEDVLTRYADRPEDTQERYIRRLPCWNNIKDNYLQSDRVVEYRYSYTIRSFTSDAEMLALFETRPDAFNEEELLRVSALVDDDEKRMEVYRATLRFFPRSAVAANNLALLLWERGDDEEAERLLARAADTLPEARYNWGMMKALRRDIEGAASLLEPFDDDDALLVKRLAKGGTR